MNKRLILFLIFFFLLFLSPFVVSAQKPEDWEPPERNGTYDVPGRQNLKVRVFVHEPPNQLSPVLVCTDNYSTAVVGPAGWKLPSTWSWYLNTSSAPSSIAASLSTIANNSITTWQDELTGKVQFNYAGVTSISRKAYDGKNIIAWGRTSGTALGVTYTWYYPSTGLAAETDTIMNKKFTWGWANTCNTSYYDAQNILTHELGHWVGLNDEYTGAYIDNTMYGYGSKGEIKKDTLTTGDVTGARNLYP